MAPQNAPRLRELAALAQERYRLPVSPPRLPAVGGSSGDLASPPGAVYIMADRTAAAASIVHACLNKTLPFHSYGDFVRRFAVKIFSCYKISVHDAELWMLHMYIIQPSDHRDAGVDYGVVQCGFNAAMLSKAFSMSNKGKSLKELKLAEYTPSAFQSRQISRCHVVSAKLPPCAAQVWTFWR